MPSAMVRNEDEALELLAFLITAARTQLDEAAEYGPLRMLTAAGRLADFIAERASPGTRGLLDVGTAAQTMLLAAHSLGLGAGLVTSFSRAAVGAILNLPEDLSPEMFICLGYAAPQQPSASGRAPP